jgi:hypothetical protein
LIGVSIISSISDLQSAIQNGFLSIRFTLSTNELPFFFSGVGDAFGFADGLGDGEGVGKGDGDIEGDANGEAPAFVLIVASDATFLERKAKRPTTPSIRTINTMAITRRMFVVVLRAAAISILVIVAAAGGGTFAGCLARTGCPITVISLLPELLSTRPSRSFDKSTTSRPDGDSTPATRNAAMSGDEISA